MKPSLQCLVLLSACSLASACSDSSASTTSTQRRDHAMDKVTAKELGGRDESAMHDKALTATAPTEIPSIAHTQEKKVELLAAPDRAKAEEKATEVEAIKVGEKTQEVAGPDFDRPLDPSEVTVKRFVLATDVKDREPIGESNVFMTDTSKIFAFIELANEGAPYAVRVHWEKVDDAPSPYGVKLDVKTAPRFRTWSWTAIKREPGRYKAVLRTLDGKDIDSREFTLEPGEECGLELE